MEDKVYPKVLIIGETFRYNGGGGITLINLFKEWPSEKIAIVTDRINETTTSPNVRFYQLGQLEHKTPFPFSIFNKINRSGEVSPKVDSTVIQSSPVKSILKPLLRKIYNNILQFLGIFYFLDKLELSDELVNWINEFSPDIIYSQPFRYKDMVFANQLKTETEIPLVIHIMDDSISFLNKPNILYFYWKKKTQQSFKNLVHSATVCMSISDAMSDEYFKRYNKNFIAFRNPIEIDIWRPFIKTSWEIEEQIKIIYTGRLAVPNINSLYSFCQVIHNLNVNGYSIMFDIYSIDTNIKFYNQIKKLQGISIKKAVSYTEIPALLSQYDITFLPIDFSNKGIKYAKFSISTKTSEYMISGVPILLFAPENVALTTYAKKYDCMICVSENNLSLLSKTLVSIIENKEIRELISLNAVEIAKNRSSGLVVRKHFYEVLSSAIQYRNL